MNCKRSNRQLPFILDKSIIKVLLKPTVETARVLLFQGIIFIVMPKCNVFCETLRFHALADSSRNYGNRSF